MAKLNFILANESVRHTAIAQLRNLPIEPVHQIVIMPFRKKRTRDQNSMQWAGMLGDFAEQGVIDGKRYSQKVWHEYLKERFLPDFPADGITLKGYEKWLEMPSGEIRLVGSTTKLTTRGFSDYINQCHAFGAGELGIRFTVVGYE